MPAALFASPFPRLDLTLDEREQLYATANTLVQEAQTQYEKFLWRDHSKIDHGKWALLRSKEDVRVYKDCRQRRGTDNKHMHLLLTVGTVIGTLNDAMYGVLNHTTDDMRLKTAYVQDTLLDSAVLETIVGPTLEEPFQSMTVRWIVKGVPLHVRMLAKHGDTVFLESTGMTKLRNGETVGFQLMQSVSFATTPSLPLYERFNMSICTLWRQRSPQRVEAFMTSYTELPDTFLVPMIIRSAADALVSLWKMIECAQLKKLAFLVAHKETFVTQQDAEGRASALVDGCTVCGGKSRSARRGAKSACALCSNAICRKCCIKRELAFFTPDGTLLKQPMRFCLPCLTTAHRLDVAAVAAAEVPRLHGRARSSRQHIKSSCYGRSCSNAYGPSVVSSTCSSVVSDQHFGSLLPTSC